MIKRHEILDSDDDGGGGDFSPVKDSTAATSANQLEDAFIDAPHLRGSGTNSTDLSFFQRVYNEQENAATSGAFGGELVEPGNASAAAAERYCLQGGKNHNNNNTTSSLTSVTDPGVPSRKAKRAAAAAGRKDLVDLTQVTTPREDVSSGRARDIWDVPSSPAAGFEGDKMAPPATGSIRSQPKAGKTYGKRKRGLLSSSQPEPPESATLDSLYLTLEASDPRTARDVPDEQSVPSLLTWERPGQGAQPSSTEHTVENSTRAFQDEHRHEVSWDSGLRGGHASSPIHDTAAEDTSASLYIAPNALTASQKQEYQVVSLSPESGQRRQEHAFPIGTGLNELPNESSGTTVAYPTPSQYASSRPGPSRRETSKTHMEQLSSSPDIIAITSDTAQNKRARHIYENDLPLPEVHPPSAAKKARRNAAKENAVEDPGVEEDGWDSEAIGFSEEHYKPRPSRRRLNLEGEEGGDPSAFPHQPPNADKGLDGAPIVGIGTVESDQALGIAGPSLSLDHLAEPPITEPQDTKPKEKRGRKKKGVQNENAALQEEADQQAQPEELQLLEADDNGPNEPAKKKRGRPRKSDAPKISNFQPDHKIDITNPSTTIAPEPEAEAQAGQDRPEVINFDGPNSANASSAKPTKGGREKKKKKKKKQEDASREETAPATEDQVLGEISQNSRGSEKQATPEKTIEALSPVTDKENATTEKLAAKDTAKVGQNQNSKVQYRVGLSKRSRIAPLLKIIRK